MYTIPTKQTASLIRLSAIAGACIPSSFGRLLRVGSEYPQLHDVDGQGHPEVWLPLRGQPEGEAESQKVRGLSWKVIGSNPSANKHSLLFSG